TQDAFQFLAGLPVFASLPREEIEKVAEAVSVKDYAKDHVLAIQGQTKIDSLYVVQKGSFALFDEKNGTKKLAGFIKSGEVFGGITILMNAGISLRTVIVDQDCHGYMIAESVFRDLCDRYTTFYEYFLEKKIFPEPAWLKEELAAAADKTPVIVETALENKADICEATLDMFVRVLGTVIGNMAVTLLPTGGIYLGGGIPPRILKRLARPDFLSRIVDKGRFFSLCANMPVHVILDPQAALHGAAWYGFGNLNI
ncbi:MAG: glucokinase, partial [Desulfobacter sp.]|nr:glucokinase [Desulfobacter sp.]